MIASNAFIVARPGQNFRGLTYQADDPAFLVTLLLYHLARGGWLQEDLAIAPNHTTIPTMLQGHNMTFLESNEPQVLICASGPNGIEILNQLSANVLETHVMGNMIVHVLDAILGIPGSYSEIVKDNGLDQFEAFRSAVGGTPLDNLSGFTAFIPIDDAQNISGLASSSNGVEIFKNHVSNNVVLHAIAKSTFTGNPRPDDLVFRVWH